MKLKNSFVYFIINDLSVNSIIRDFKDINVNFEIIYGKDRTIFKINYQDFKTIKQYYPYYDIKIINCSGILYYLYLIKKYYLASINLILSIIFTFIMSFFIVDIDIKTNDKELKEIVNNALLNENIKPYSFRKSFDEIQKIKENIKTQNSQYIDWIEIKQIGMKYIVNVERKIINKDDEKPSYCNVYAKKDGMVKRVKTYQGIAMVAMNDYVKKGDLLISGDIKVNDEIVSNVCANGEVYAEVWYKVNIKIPLDYYEYINTKKQRNNIVIQTKNHEYQLFKKRIDNYDSNKELLTEIFGIKIYLRKDYEIKKIPKRYTLEEVLEKGMKMAIDKVNNKLEKDEKIIYQKVLQKQLIDSTMNIDIFIIAEERIGYSNIEGR